MRRRFLPIFVSFILSIFIMPSYAHAICPVCTVAVCAGVGLSRWLGIDDTITGLWIGGLAVSLIAWTILWLNQKNIRFFSRNPLIVIVYYLAIIWPLYQFDIAGHPANTLWGFDKLMVGIIIGSLAFLAGILLNDYLKSRNKGKAFFSFQKVALPIGMLAAISAIFYLICKI